MAKRRLGARRGGALRATPAALAALALAGVAIALVATIGRQEAPPQTVVDDALSAGGTAAAEPFRQAGGAFGFVQNAVTANARIAELEREAMELRQWRTLALALAERNERYEALLKMPSDNLAEALRPGAGVSARLVLDVGGPFRRTLLANAGSDHGVASGAVALNENGLVGRVVVVGRRSARVLMLDDYNSRVPVMGQSSRVRAVMVGSARAAPSLEGPIRAEAPHLQFVVGAEGLKLGEAIVTSGDGGLYPPGLVVGQAAQDGSGRWRVRLAAAQAPIDFVRLLPYAAVEAPEAAEGVQSGVSFPTIAPRALTSSAPAAAAPQTVIAAPAVAAAPRRAPVGATQPIATAAEEDAAPPAPDQEPPQ